MVAALLQLRRGASAAELCERPEPIHLTLNGRARPDLIRANKTARPGSEKQRRGRRTSNRAHGENEPSSARETQPQATRIRSEPVTQRHEGDDKAHSCTVT